MIAKPRSRFWRDISCGDLLAAATADQARIGDFATTIVAQYNWRTGRVGQMLIAPPHQNDDRPEQIVARVGESVLVALRILRIRHPVEKASVDEHPQPRRQRRPRNPEVSGQ